MSSSVVTGASSSCSAAYARNLSSIPSAHAKPLTPHSQKSSFQGLSLQEAKWGVSTSFMADISATSTSRKERKGLDITARTAGASKTIEVEVDKPLGLTLGQKSGGGVVITGVEGGGNAARAGLKVGDQVLYTSSFFGDELWPADKLGFTKTAVQAKADSIYFVVNRGPDVDVKRLQKRPAPPRFGRKLTEAQKARLNTRLNKFVNCYASVSFIPRNHLTDNLIFQARATHICLDCGYIYTLTKPFEQQASFCH